MIWLSMGWLSNTEVTQNNAQPNGHLNRIFPSISTGTKSLPNLDLDSNIFIANLPTISVSCGSCKKYLSLSVSNGLDPVFCRRMDLAESEVVEPQTTEPKAGDACNMGKVDSRNAQSHKLLSPWTVAHGWIICRFRWVLAFAPPVPWGLVPRWQELGWMRSRMTMVAAPDVVGNPLFRTFRNLTPTTAD